MTKCNLLRHFDENQGIETDEINWILKLSEKWRKVSLIFRVNFHLIEVPNGKFLFEKVTQKSHKLNNIKEHIRETTSL